MISGSTFCTNTTQRLSIYLKHILMLLLSWFTLLGKEHKIWGRKQLNHFQHLISFRRLFYNIWWLICCVKNVFLETNIFTILLTERFKAWPKQWTMVFFEYLARHSGYTSIHFFGTITALSPHIWEVLLILWKYLWWMQLMCPIWYCPIYIAQYVYVYLISMYFINPSNTDNELSPLALSVISSAMIQ